MTEEQETQHSEWQDMVYKLKEDISERISRLKLALVHKEKTFKARRPRPKKS